MKTYNLTKSAAPDRSALVTEVKERVAIDKVVAQLDLETKYNMTRTGNSIQGDCPTGHASSNHRCFSVNLDVGYFHCFSCNEAGDVLSLVELVRKTGFRDALQWLVQQFAPDLKPMLDTIEEGETPEQKQHYRRASLYGLVYSHGHNQLFESTGQVALDYLIKVRGYDPAKLKDAEFTYWDTDQNIRSYLLSVAPDLKEDIAELSLQGGSGDEFRLAIPFRDRSGAILGFLKRAHEKTGFTIRGQAGIRWDSTKGITKPDLFGLHRIRKETQLIVVEGYPDATYLPTLGMSNVVALGQAAFSDKYVGGLRLKGIKQLVLALDNDGGTGNRNSEEICRIMADSDIKVFVIDPPTLGKHKDPDEFVVANGLDAFRLLVKEAEAASKWMSKRMLLKHDTKTDIGRETAIMECLEYADTLDNPREAGDVLNDLSTSLGLSDELLAEEFGKLQQKRAADRLSAGIKETSTMVQRTILSGEPEKALKALQDAAVGLQAEFWKTTEPETVGIGEFLVKKRQVDSQRIAGQRLGFELKDFAEIDRELRGLQTGLYVIAADPNIGKTAFMVSLAVDVLKSNPDAACLFFSMDDSRDMIVSRFLAHISDMKINEVRFKLTDPKQVKHIDTAYEQLRIWAIGNRLDIKESSAHLTMSRIENEIREHPRREKVVVFIDGLYNVPMDEDYGSIREQNIERANQVKRLVREFKAPVIATAEYRKQGREESNQSKGTRTIHDIMETGKYGYNADLVILLSPKDPSDYVRNDEPIIVADFGKNKLESFRGKMEFKFIRAKSVMTFVPGTTTQP